MAKKQHGGPVPPQKKPLPPKRSIGSYIFSALMIFAVIIGLYGAIADTVGKRPETVALSQVARLVDAGEVKTLS